MSGATKLSGAAGGLLPAGGLRLRVEPEAGIGRTGVLLVGTRAGVRGLRASIEAQVGEDEHRFGVVGCVLIGEPGAEPGASGGTGVAVLGGIEDVERIRDRHGVRVALVSAPRDRAGEMQRAERALRGCGIVTRFVPVLDDLVREEPDVESAVIARGLVGVGADDAGLIGRTSHELDRRLVSRVLVGRRVLITGAGGSIGSELARLIAAFRPGELVLVERSENALFEIDRQIGRRFPEVSRRAVLHDVVDAEGTRRLVEECGSDVVLHAAAHKHVPLMEDHPSHAIVNNVFGTRSIVDACVRAGVERFVMISSDKAVHPTSVMGATKRLAELYVRGVARRGVLAGGRAGGAGRAGRAGTRLSMVRFGNVLGSACSVLQIWSAQLADGGPITVTDPRMTRYFMTIREAATLVLQAASMDEGPSESAPVYVLDMGEPVKILDLAERFVRRHGLTPRVVDGLAAGARARADEGTMPIVISGIRPGEKLHEELAYQEESLRATGHPAVRVWAEDRGGDEPVGREAWTERMIRDLSAARYARDRESALSAIARWVPELTRDHACGAK